MEKKTASSIMLTLLLTSMLSLAFNVQPAEASGTIYIRADGSIDPPTAPIQRNGDIYTFTGDVYANVIIERDSIVVDGAGYTVQGAGFGSGIGIHLNGGYNITLKDLKVTKFDYGIRLDYSTFSFLFNIAVSYNSWVGIYLVDSDNNIVFRNSASNNGYQGIELDNSFNNNVSLNGASENQDCGILLSYSNDNILHGNGGLVHNECGIWLEKSQNNSIFDNIVWGIISPSYGIRVHYFSEDNMISGNEISGCQYGVWLEDSSNNTLAQNTVCDNQLEIALDRSHNCKLFDNDVRGKNDPNVGDTGICIKEESDKNEICRNKVEYNGAAGILLADFSHYNKVSDNTVQYNLGVGIYVGSSNNSIHKNVVYLNEHDGISLGSNYNDICENSITANSWYGISLYECANNSIVGNNITANSWGGTHVQSSNDNKFYHNNFISNTYQIHNYQSNNTWGNGYPSGGNYWSDYNGTDLYHGPYQNITGSDGIGDTPYIIDEDNRDNYPIMKPYPRAAHDAGITSVTTSKDIVGQGYTASINVMMFNYGNDTETFNVTIYANQTIIGEICNINLTGRNSTTLTITWNTAGFALGNYTVSARTEPLPEEVNTEDNSYTGGTVYVGIPGDVDGDFENGHYDVDLFDAVKLLVIYGAKLGDSNFDPNCDIDNSGQVFLFDAVILLSHYNEIVYP
jgi:parallel beta-helix repeat protein